MVWLKANELMAPLPFFETTIWAGFFYFYLFIIFFKE